MLAYVGAIERETTITIDGYTSNKTIKGILKDVSRAVRKYDEGEAECLEEFVKDGVDEFNTPFVAEKDSCGGYFFEVYEVSCASSYNEETDENETKDGFHNYFCIRIVK